MKRRNFIIIAIIFVIVVLASLIIACKIDILNENTINFTNKDVDNTEKLIQDVVDNYKEEKQINVENNNIEDKENEISEDGEKSKEDGNIRADGRDKKIDIIKDEVLVKIVDYIPNIIIDLRYATTNNFTGVVIYKSDVAYLRYGTVKKLKKVQEQLNKQGYSLIVYDAYRPVEAQFKLWEVCPNPTFVANPINGYSSHSRGNTVDVGLVKLDGTAIEMPSEFDDFSDKANRDYSDVSIEAKNNALLLENTMKNNGFNTYQKEWWHFSDVVSYQVYEE